MDTKFRRENAKEKKKRRNLGDLGVDGGKKVVE
jgi:hypothetical protein